MVKVIVGLMGSSVASGSSKLATVAQVQTYLDMCKKHNVTELDTARVYNAGRSESLLGEADSTGFLIETKAPGFSPGSLTASNILSNASASLAAIGRPSFDLYYFHGPDRTTDLEDSCRAIGQLHAEGKLKAFGVSNIRADEVESIIEICTRNNWPKPTVYQGGYSPIARAAETGLFPTLRKHGMAFYAYSPLAGGFFSRSAEQLRNPPEGGRMAQMQVFKDMFVTEDTLRVHDKLTQACKDEGTTMKEAALRWFMHHAPLTEIDGVILGASSTEQLEENLIATEKGPLGKDVLAVLEELWEVQQPKGFKYHV